ncbi:MAG: conjugal transfer protein TraL [Sneathiella sp.]|nr:conjugal transfer protein TraL [Sneathiella sp.]
MTQVHFILQGKGGVGKSFVAALLQQHFTSRNFSPIGIDTDPVNATFASYKSFNVQRLEIMRGDNINPRVFDELIEQILDDNEDSIFVVDNGAATFVPLCAYLFENNVIDFLQQQSCNINFHTVLTGGQALNDTTNGLSNLFEHFKNVPVCVWINEYFGKLEKNGKSFEQSNLYKNNQDQIRGLIRIQEVRRETFGADLDHMLRNKLTFTEAIESSDFNVMAKQRLRMIWRDLNDQMTTLQF